MMKWRVMWAAAMVLGGLVGGTVTAEAADAKIAYVDVQRAIASSDAAKKARETLQRMLDVKQREVTSMENELKRMKEDLENGKSVSTAEAQNERAERFRNRYRDFQRLLEDNQAALDRENGLWTKKITGTIRKTIEELSRERGFSMVVGKGQVLYSSPSIDITEEVMERMNRQTRDMR